MLGLLSGLREMLNTLTEQEKTNFGHIAEENGSKSMYESLAKLNVTATEEVFKQMDSLVSYMTVKKIGKPGQHVNLLVKVRISMEDELRGEFWDELDQEGREPKLFWADVKVWMKYKNWLKEGQAPRGPIVRKVDELLKKC